MKYISVKKRKDTLYFCTTSKTDIGILVDAPPYTKLTIANNLSVIGVALLNTLSGYKEGIKYNKEINKDILNAFGIKSYRQIQDRLSRNCNIEENKGIIRIIPSKNIGDNRGFVFLPELSIIQSISDSPEQIGEALLRGFEMCQYGEEADEPSHV